MQIRELNLKELESVYGVLSQLRPTLSYEEFEDLIYDMRHSEYKMFGIMEGDVLVSYAGGAVQTTLAHKRHLYVYDFVTDEEYKSMQYTQWMFEYLHDYAKSCMCVNIVIASEILDLQMHYTYRKNGFKKRDVLFCKKIV